MFNLAKKLFGSENDRRLKRMRPTVEKINALEPEFEALRDEEIKLKTEEFKKRYQDGESLDDLLPEAFANVREAAKRTLGQRHYDVQLIGGMCLHAGDIAEMRTGEGKTLVATLAAYLNALTGNGVHIVTVNDYLASRDAEWMSQVYGFLGMTTGTIVHGLTDMQRREAYQCDITYGTNNEFGFDYLRDNMKYSLPEMAQRGHHFAIIDEVDSILIDEARTPLIISGPTDDRSDFYITIDEIIPLLGDDDFELDEKQRSVTLNEDGNERVEEILKERGLMKGESLYDIENVSVVHHVNQALKAHKLYSRDKDYIVKGEKVVLIDEFTGRMMDGRRLSEGLHQAIEAKERVDIQPENQTLASITFQNYFRLYNKLAGMTGTAVTEASEFAEIYSLEVLEIPTNRPIQRIDDDDEIYKSAQEKYNAILDEIADAHSRKQPMLVGTVSIEKSELLSELLKKRGVPHKVLNARYHEQEAAIVAQAGVPGAITIATNMAGRGTDIQLGGNLEMRLETEAPEGETEKERAKRQEKLIGEIAELKKQALEAGGLYVLGTERHESRRIDNQLRGRTGRQGDPGRSKFYISTEDDLMRIFGGDRLESIMNRLGWEEGEALTHRWMNKAIERAQIRVEQRNFDIRKNVLKYDDVMNDQRKAIFEQRMEFLTAEDVSEVIRDMRHEAIEDLVMETMPPKAYAEQWDIDELDRKVKVNLGLDLPIRDWAAEEGIANEEVENRLIEAADKAYAEKREDFGEDVITGIEKNILLRVIDNNWREHLQQLDHLRSVVGLRGYGQRDPLNEFKSEAFTLFENLLSGLREAVTRVMMNVRMERRQAPPPPPQPPQQMRESHIDPATGENDAVPADQADVPKTDQTWGKVARNSPCPCGSGKKYKHCHGQVSHA